MKSIYVFPHVKRNASSDRFDLKGFGSVTLGENVRQMSKGDIRLGHPTWRLFNYSSHYQIQFEPSHVTDLDTICQQTDVFKGWIGLLLLNDDFLPPCCLLSFTNFKIEIVPTSCLYLRTDPFSWRVEVDEWRIFPHPSDAFF